MMTMTASLPSPLLKRRPAAWRTVVPLLLATWLAGCVVGPDYKAPVVSLPAQWTDGQQKEEPATMPDLSRWWERLGDPMLTSLIEDAVNGNLDVATAKAKIREARASYRQAGGTLLPSVDGSASATRSKTGGAGTPPSNEFKAGFDSSWELDLFGANQRTVEAARYGVDAAEQEMRSTLLTLIGDITSYYVDARGYQARIALAKRTAASQRETATLTRSKFEAGASSAVDVANAIGLASSTEADIPALEISYAETIHRLSVLTGREPTALAARMKGSAAIPSPSFPIPTGVPANILLSRPDVRLAERQLAQYTAKVGEAEAARYPSISLTGSLSTTGETIGDLAKHSSIGWAFGPSLSIPIFSGGQLKAAVEVAEAQRDQYYIAFRSAVLTALEDVENAINALAQERLKTGKLAESADAYRKAATLSRTLYQTGSSSFLDALDAERSLYSAEDSLIQSRVTITKDYIALNKALGGGWDGKIDASKPEVVDTDTGPHIEAESKPRP